MGPIDLVVFDMAGTTVDDAGNLVLTSLVEAARTCDLPGSADELNAMMGMNKREVFTILAERRAPAGSAEAGALAERALIAFIEHLRGVYERSLRPLPGAEDTFRFLRARGIKIATDTGFEAQIGSMIVDRLGWLDRGLIDTAIFSTDVPRGRPAPYMIFRAMERLGVLDVRRVMKLGDSPADLEEGANAGCGEVIGVLSGAHTVATLGRYTHTRIIGSVAELPGLFD
ncbi:MAG TPA: HAD family hydrolase [Chloroflexota bacterium]|jgi:phosphonatase-like hydrolase|nr:HAD family hydrolase [Chloroflexota bacterium]